MAPLKKAILPQRHRGHREKNLSFSVKIFSITSQKVNFLNIMFKISVLSVVNSWFFQ